MRTRLR
jgi:hypothetical protein